MKLHGTTIVLGAVVLLLLILLAMGCSMSCGNKEGLLVDGVDVNNLVIDGVPVNNGLVGEVVVDPLYNYDINTLNRLNRGNSYTVSGNCFDLYACNPEPFYQGRLAFSLYDDCQSYDRNTAVSSCDNGAQSYGNGAMASY